MTLTIAPTGILEVDFANHSLTVTDSGGVLVKQGGSLAQTGRLSPPQSVGSAENLLVFHHSDHLTGASVDTDSQGELIQLTDYYPFGDSRIEDTTTAFHNDYTYTGKERDEDTELLYYEARYYDSGIGRFLSLDPWGGDVTDPQSLNKYTYTLNNPLKYTDPDGEKVYLVTRDLGNNRYLGDYGRMSHSFLYIVPDNPGDFGAESGFAFTLGGQKQEDGSLAGEINNSDDLATFELRTKSDGSYYRTVNSLTEIATPEGMTDTEFINTITSNSSWYNQNAEEFNYSAASLGGYNCHNYSTTMIETSGGIVPPEAEPSTIDPGFFQSIPQPSVHGPVQQRQWQVDEISSLNADSSNPNNENN